MKRTLLKFFVSQGLASNDVFTRCSSGFHDWDREKKTVSLTYCLLGQNPPRWCRPLSSSCSTSFFVVKMLGNRNECEWFWLMSSLCLRIQISKTLWNHWCVFVARDVLYFDFKPPRQLGSFSRSQSHIVQMHDWNNFTGGRMRFFILIYTALKIAEYN